MNPLSNNRWVKAHTTENIFETDLVRDALDNEGIVYIVREHKETAYDGLFILQKGFATILVEEENREKAREIVERIKHIPYVVSPEG